MRHIKKTKAPFIVSFYPGCSASPWKLELRASFAGKRIRRFFSTKAEAWEEGVRLMEQIRRQESGLSKDKETDGIIWLATVDEIQAAIQCLPVKQMREVSLWLKNYETTMYNSLEDIGQKRKFINVPITADKN